ncbi:hypothetical protein H4R18_000476 [Coemansia javaensis]|uniref:Extracellular membrane protein CFEM domain-containing protein n=1 Tax=Coemansia javaensis TaxID=2761396 RepID=A0A9W8HPG0_9FUNG|nr:hypothetical protein H4R18_000476 [Coemansia javaensis]
MAPAAISLAWILVLLAGTAAGECENPVSFKKCLAQTRAEVNICGINMTCKCARQESVVQCYEKCGDDKYYRRLRQGEEGLQQILCSQKRAGETEDLPIIAVAHDPDRQQKQPDAKPAPAAPPAPERRASKSDRDDGPVLDAIDGAAGPAIGAHLLAAGIVLAAL